MARWSLYLVRTRADALYAGVSTDVARRLREHAGSGRGAKALRARGPLRLAYQVEIGERALALAAERRVKRLRKRDKEAIVAAAMDRAQLLAALGLAPEIPGAGALP